MRFHDDKGETVEAKLKRPGRVATDDLSSGEDYREKSTVPLPETREKEEESERKRKKENERKRKRRELGRSRST
jgi:hypothetical protein